MSYDVLIAFGIPLCTTVFSIWFALRGREINFKQWSIGDRGLGTLLVWFLSAGEIYTTFAFLGATGWAYLYGAPGFWVFANVALAFTLGYWLLPRIWVVAKRHDIYTLPDFFTIRFGSKWLGAMAAIVGVLYLIPYTQVQFTGLSLILQVLFPGSISKTMAIVVAGMIVLAFTFSAGLRSTALAAAVKDVMVLAVIVAAIVLIGTVPHIGGIVGILTEMKSRHPDYATLPGMMPQRGYTPLWFMSSIILTNISYWMSPQLFQATVSAQSPDVLRRNAVLQPLYALLFLPIFLLGFAALIALPGLKVGDTALLALVAHYYPRWFIGATAATGMLVAMVASSGLLLALATIFAKAVYRDLLAPKASDAQVLRVGRTVLIVAVVVAALLAIRSTSTLIIVALIGIAAVAQLAPGLILSLVWARVTKWGVLVGTLIGVIGTTVPPVITLEKSISFTIQYGLVALAVNAIATVLISIAWQEHASEAMDFVVFRE